MDLSRATAVFRPRNAWEAMDLGIRMVQTNFEPLAKRWVIGSAPWAALALLAAYLLDNPLWAYVLFWWFKPAFDRIPLHYLSRRLFDGDPGALNIWSLCFKQPFSFSAWRHLTYLRLSPSRSYSLPVYQLEGRNQSYQSSRLRTLLARDYSASAWLTIAFFCIAVVLHATTSAFIMSLGQSDVAANQVSNPFERYFVFWENYATYMVILDFIVFYLIHGLLELFYVGAGFALYLNRRTHLEAWDVELAFRRIATRSSRAVGVIFAALVVGCLMSFESAPVYAQSDDNSLIDTSAPLATDPPDETVVDALSAAQKAEQLKSREISSDIYASGEFGKLETRQRWKAKKTSADDEIVLDDFNFSGPTALISTLAGLLKIVIAGLFLFLLAAWAYTNRHLFLLQSETDEEEGPSVRQESQSNLKEEFIPDPDVPQKVMGLWNSGQHRESMSYLYRSAVAYLQEKHNLVIDDSDTEGDCQRQVVQKAKPGVSEYFRRVTRAWQDLAYGEISLETELVADLCSHWPQLSEVGTSDSTTQVQS